MKLFSAVFVIGLIAFALLLAAFKVSILSLEMFTHTLFHFFIGFVAMSYFFFHRTLKLMKLLSMLLLVLLILDQVFDYTRGVGDMSVELLLLNFYLVFWGGLSGLCFTRFWTSE